MRRRVQGPALPATPHTEGVEEERAGRGRGSLRQFVVVGSRDVLGEPPDGVPIGHDGVERIVETVTRVNTHRVPARGGKTGPGPRVRLRLRIRIELPSLLSIPTEVVLAYPGRHILNSRAGGVVGIVLHARSEPRALARPAPSCRDERQEVDLCRAPRYSRFKHIEHKGLRRLCERNDARSLHATHVRRIRRILYMLRSARQPRGMDQPGFRLHPLRGEYQGHWSVTVPGSWRIVFRFEAGEATDVDLVDYH